MSFALLAYQAASSGAVTYADLAAAPDPDFTQRNGHYTFTEQYQLLYDYWNSATITAGRYSVPTWNAIGQFNGWPLEASASVPLSPPRIGKYLNYGPVIPLNEEFQMQISDTAAGGTQLNAAIVIATTDWNANLPRGRMRMRVLATGAVASLAHTWSGPQALVLDASLRGGVYAVVNAYLQCATYGEFFRLIFPRTKLYHGRKLRPGWLCNNALGDLDAVTVQDNPEHLGVWGYFHTFELPQWEYFGNAAHAATQVLILDLIYLGESLSLLDQYISGGSAVTT